MILYNQSLVHDYFISLLVSPYKMYATEQFPALRAQWAVVLSHNQLLRQPLPSADSADNISSAANRLHRKPVINSDLSAEAPYSGSNVSTTPA